MRNFIKKIFQLPAAYFETPKAVDTIADKIADCERQMLENQASAHYHTKLAEYYAESIVRLQKFKPARLTIS